MKKKKEELPKSKKNEKKQDNENIKIVNQKLGWLQIIVSLGKPLYDTDKKKWRVLNGYQSVLGNKDGQLFFEVTFTDTPYWENFKEKNLYFNILEDELSENKK